MVELDIIPELFRWIKEAIYNNIPPQYQIFVAITFYTILITIYGIFIWKFYRFLAKRDILSLELEAYNVSEKPGIKKFVAALFFLLEYIIFTQLLIFFWFAVLAIFLLVLSKNPSITEILTIATAIVGATRIAAYYSEDLSKDLAKMFPFTLLGIFLIDKSFFSFDIITERFLQIPNLIGMIFAYLIFLFVLESLIRLISLVKRSIWD